MMFPELADAASASPRDGRSGKQHAESVTPPRPAVPCGRGRAVPGDAYDRLPDLAPNSIDLLLSSPPYWGQRTYNLSHNWDVEREWKAHGGHREVPPPYEWYRAHGGVLGLEPLPEWYVSHLVELFERFAPALKPSGSMWVNIGDTYFARWSSIRQRGRQGLGASM